MNHAKTSFSTETCAGAIISVVQYLALLRYFKHLVSGIPLATARVVSVKVWRACIAPRGCTSREHVCAERQHGVKEPLWFGLLRAT
jgi:hypothetical protein